MAIANANVNNPSFREENLLYTEVHEPEKERDGPYMEQTDENPLYEPATADDAGLSPIYDRYVFCYRRKKNLILNSYRNCKFLYCILDFNNSL